ncbi:endonuclease domain-containing protein [Mesorhizobium tianshanense]|uniref:endonuclease domain-containing protein n=1 Tax=Mesorhizobium tianshanense TaxID=39844 RepID=UPI003898FE46
MFGPGTSRTGVRGHREQFPILSLACVEVDGSQHAEAAGDGTRTRRLQQDGWIILRFWNDDVIRDIDNVCQHILIEAGLAGTP